MVIFFLLSGLGDRYMMPPLFEPFPEGTGSSGRPISAAGRRSVRSDGHAPAQWTQNMRSVQGSTSVSLGIFVAIACARLPVLTQAYNHRLEQAVREFRIVVGDFDASARAYDLPRGEALDQMRGAPFLDRRVDDMEHVVVREARLGFSLSVRSPRRRTIRGDPF